MTNSITVVWTNWTAFLSSAVLTKIVCSEMIKWLSSMKHFFLPSTKFTLQKDEIQFQNFAFTLDFNIWTFSTKQNKIKQNKTKKKPERQTSTLSQRKGRAPQPSITFSCRAGGWVGGGGVLHDNDNDNYDMYMTPLGRFDLQLPRCINVCSRLLA